MVNVTFRDKVRHCANPQHVYCRLKKVFGKEKALRFAKRYESTFLWRLIDG
jgi:hypothetical protein